MNVTTGINIIFIVIVWPDHAQTTTYNNREEHANYHNTTNTVSPILNDDTCTYNTPHHVLLSEQNIYPWTVLPVSYHYKDTSKPAGLIHSGYNH
jgi:hypothetical protein